MNTPTRIGIALVLAAAASFLFLNTLGAWLELIRRLHCVHGNGGLLCQAVGALQIALYAGIMLVVPLLIGLTAWFFHRLLAPPSAGARPGGVSLGAVLLAYLALIGLAGFGLTLALDIPTANNAVDRGASVLLACASGVAAWNLWRLHSGGRWLAMAVLVVATPLTAQGLLSQAAMFSPRQASSYLVMFVMETSLLIYLMRPSLAHAFRRMPAPR